MVTFIKKCVLTFRIYVFFQGMKHSRSCKKHKLLRRHSVLALKMLIFEVFLPVDEPLLATFKECRALTFLKHIVEQGTNIMKP